MEVQKDEFNSTKDLKLKEELKSLIADTENKIKLVEKALKDEMERDLMKEYQTATGPTPETE